MTRWFIRALISCLAVLPLLPLLPAQARAEPPLDIEETVQLALANNERARKAPLRVEAAEGQLDRARSAFLPTIVASASATLTPPDERTARVLAGSGVLSVNQPILAPAAFPAYAQARHQRDAERWGAVQDRRLVAFDAARAFLVVLTSERLFDVATRRLERARANQQNTEARAAAQLASTNDVTRSLLETAAAAREVTQAQGSVSRAYLNLGFLVGRPVSGPLAAPDGTTRAAETGAVVTGDAVRSAESRRPDVRSAEERTAALEAGAREPLYRLAPTLAASGQVRLIVDPTLSGRTYDAQAQLTLSWTLYDAGQRYADRRTRLAQAKSQALDEQQLRRSVATDVGLAQASLQAARETYRIADEAVRAAQVNSQETEILYQQGLARAIELVDANARRYEAEVSRETARLAMEQAYLELRYALGLDPVGAPPAGGPAPQEGAP